MNTAAERLAIKEASCVEDIKDFFEINELDELDNVDDLGDSINKIAELSKDFRHVHAELKFSLDEVEYKNSYSGTNGYVEKMRDFLKNAKYKLKTLKKCESNSFEKKKAISEEEYVLGRLTRGIDSTIIDEIVSVSEANQIIFKLEALLEDYYRSQCSLKIVLSDEYDLQYENKVKTNEMSVKDKILECKMKIDEIVRVEKDVEEKRIAVENEKVRTEHEEAKKKLLETKEEELRVAKESSTEIELRCTQLLAKLVTTPSTLGDHQLFHLGQNLSDLDTEFNDILTRVTTFSKCASSAETNKLLDILVTKRTKLLDAKNKYVKEVQDEILVRDLSEEKLKSTSGLKFELSKFHGYDSELDIYSFKSKFEKLVQPRVLKSLRADTLKLNYLVDPALSLVKKLEDIDEIWKKLLSSFGNTRLLLQNKLCLLEKLGGLWKVRGDEKLILAISNLINCMQELSELALSHNLENELYYGGALEKILNLIGENREKKFLKGNLGSALNKKQEWNALIKSLESELKLREKYVLNAKSKICLGLDTGAKSKMSGKGFPDRTGGTSYNSEASIQSGKPVCHICGRNDHMSYTSPFSGRQCVSYLACRTFVESTPKERLKILEEKGFCRQCLTPGAKINHAKSCNNFFCCKDAGHPKNEMGYHVLVCALHRGKSENLSLLEQFKTKVLGKFGKELPQFSKNIRISFFNDTESANTVNSDSDHVVDKGIFMLQTITVGGEKFNVFYDSGCSDLVCCKSAIERLQAMGRASQVLPGPIILSGVGDTKTVCNDGIYKIQLPLSGRREAVLTGLCLDVVTSPFPSYPLGVVDEDIRKHCLTFRGNKFSKKLPKLPESVGGETHIMIGVKNMKYFPREIYRLPSGLSIHKSVFISSDGTNGVVAGPHASFSEVGNVSNQARYYACKYSVEVAEYIKKCQLAIDVPLLGMKEISDPCRFSDVDLGPQSYAGSRAPKIVNVFDKIDKAGTEISYRCMDCRECPECKKSDRFESISIQEEIEQTIIERSVKVEVDKGRSIAKLPFLSNPALRLRPNEGMALKVYQSQIRKLIKSPSDMDQVIKSQGKLHDLGYVKNFSDLDPEDQKLILDSFVKYFIPWRASWNPKSISTPCRLVFDASQSQGDDYSLNDLLAKGSNNMNKLVEILIRWSVRKCGFHTDIQKMYNAVHLDKSHWMYQMYLWSDDFDIDKPIWKVIITLIYGVKSSGNQAECALRKTAKFMENEYERVSEIVHRDIYVDDCMSGENDQESVRVVTDQLKLVLSKGGFTLKGVTESGSDPPEHLSEDGESVSVGGMKWFPKGDFLKLNISELNFSRKQRGRKSQTVAGEIPDNLTRRDCVGKVAEIFDPLGKITPIISGMKIDLNELSTRKLDWDDPIPKDLKSIWLRNFEIIQDLRDVQFCRTIVPDNAVDLSIETIDTGDASEKVICVAIYARFKLKDGKYSCSLVFARSKIVPKDMTMPRAELLAATLNATTGHVVKISFGKYHTQSLKLTDSQIALHWINNSRSELKLWARNKVIELIRLSDLERWRYVQSHDNIADLGTRRGVKIKDISSDSEWQNGKPWMRERECNFPVKTVSEITITGAEQTEIDRECTKPDLNVHISVPKNNEQVYCPNKVVSDEVKPRYEYSKYLIDPNRLRFRKVIRTLALVYLFVRKFCEKYSSKSSFPIHSIVNQDPVPKHLSCLGNQYLVTSGSNKLFNCPGGNVICLTDVDIKYAMTYFFRKATSEVKHFLSPSLYNNISSEIEGILYYDSRILPSSELSDSKELCDVMLDLSSTTFVVPLTDRHSPVAHAIVNDVHMFHKVAKHKGVETVLRYSQMVAHIIGGRDLVKKYSTDCTKCRIERKKSVKVKMGPLPNECLKIAPVFYRSQVDLFGPFDSYSNLNKRKTIKIWFVVFCCTSTSAVDLKVMEDYSTESFLLAFVRFSCRFGYPKFLHPDEGSQLIKGCSSMIMDFTSLKHQLHTEYGVQYETCPVGAHYMHGKVERKIQQVKKSMSVSMMGKRLSIIQWETLVQDVANGVNNLPLGLGNKVDNLENLDILTPNRLLLGRNNDRCPAGPLRVTDNVRHVLQTNMDIYQTWFKCWLISYVPTLIHRPKWHDSCESVSIGDVVLFLKSDKEFDKKYQYGIIRNVHPGKDSLIRKVDVEYQNSSEKVKRSTTRGVRDLIVVHPVDELGINAELSKLSQI